MQARCYRKSLQFHVHHVSRMRKYISSVLQLALRRLYSCSQLCMLLACIYINNLYCKLQSSSSCSTHRFLPYRSRSPTMFNILLCMMPCCRCSERTYDPGRFHQRGTYYVQYYNGTLPLYTLYYYVYTTVEPSTAKCTPELGTPL